jgi:hypothetical protein
VNGRAGGDRIGIAMALLWLLAALLVNEWTVARGLSPAHLGPRARAFLRALDVALVAWAVAGLRFRRADAVKNLNVLLLSLVALLAGVTVLVQRVPRVLGYEFASGVWSRYSTRPNGIYYEDPVLRMNFMLPNYRTEMYYNAYTWTHQTDALGFRNPRTMTEADVILLGDSFIYGHGVEIDQTVGRALERLTPYSVVNLARQGDCALQEAYLLTRHIERFRPRHVVYFYYRNDILDLFVYRTPAELAAFVYTPLEAIRYPEPLEVATAVKLRDEQNAEHARLDPFRFQLSRRIHLFQLPIWLAQRARRWRLAMQLATWGEEQDGESLGWRYTKKAILYMDRLARAHGAQFVMAPIVLGDHRQREILESFARSHGIALVDTRELSRDLAGPNFLPHDGHFSPAGAETMAQLVAGHLEEAARRVR